jgi:hypothetical protein
MAPGGAPTTNTGPSPDPSVFLSALGRLTGAVDGTGTPLVFDIGGGGGPLRGAIVNAIQTSATTPIDIALTTGGTVPAGLAVGITPGVRPNVPPGGQACFDVTFSGSGLPVGAFDLRFTAVQSGALLGSIPVTVACSGSSTTTSSSLPTIPTSTTTTSTTSTTGPRCGNGVLDPGETCDPPDPTPIPGVVPPQATCRPDCTFCGDAVVQAADGETCDDGNR